MPRAKTTISTGQRFTHWTVVARSDRKKHWLCQCKCGTRRDVFVGNLTTGLSSSCGCANTQRHLTHGMSRSPIYNIWSSMIQRCFDPKCKSYSNYGGRGITVCYRWRAFKNFYADMGDTPFDGATLDRTNNNGNYEPSNCRWATRTQQSRNTRRSRYITFNEQTLCLQEWANITNIKRTTLAQRLGKHWPLERVFTRTHGRTNQPLKNHNAQQA